MDIISELTFSETECNRDMCPVDEEGQHGREDGVEWRARMHDDARMGPWWTNDVHVHLHVDIDRCAYDAYDA